MNNSGCGVVIHGCPAHVNRTLILCFDTCSCFRKDDWSDKRMAMDDRYGRSDFGRQDRFQDFDHRDRGRYQDDMMMERRDGARGIGADRDGQVRSWDPRPPDDFFFFFFPGAMIVNLFTSVFS